MRLAARPVQGGRLASLHCACVRAVGIPSTPFSHALTTEIRGWALRFVGGSSPRDRSRAVRRVGTDTMPVINDHIELSDTEQQLFNDLVAAAKQANLGTTLRCAGGWVRDKLMGRESLDIDIALDNTLGKDFAEQVNQYLKAHGQETHKVAVIVSNPEQSKHLETARIRVRGLWIDLVNLRSEEYAHHSRIPTMEFGTPEQDAYRRDFTINSLFYNVNAGAVEDLTGQGLQDLRQGIIRTPLPPRETFLDDPLRVLRAVRFASRFGFSLDDALLEAASDDQVRDMLGHKVSRERIGMELDGMMGGPDPVLAVQLLRRLCLFEAVFEVHPSATEDVTEEFAAAGSALFAALHAILCAWDPQPSSDERRQAMLAGLLLPLRQVELKSAKGRPQSLSSHVIRDSLKWKSKDCEAVDLLHRTAPQLLKVHQQLASISAAAGSDSSHEEVRIALGRCIRSLKSLWRYGCALATLLPAPEARPLGVEAAAVEAEDAALGSPDLRTSVDSQAAAAEAGSDGQPSAEVLKRVEVCKALVAAAEGYGIADCWQWRPVLDGKQVMAAVGMDKGGPRLGVLMGLAMDWQLAHPQGSADECRAWLVQHQESAEG